MPNRHRKHPKPKTGGNHSHEIMLSPSPKPATTASLTGKSSATVFLMPSDTSAVKELSLSAPATVKAKTSSSQSLFKPEPSALRNDLASPSTSTSPTLEELVGWFKKGADEFSLKI